MKIKELIAQLSEHHPEAEVTFSVAIDSSIDEDQRWFCEDDPIAIQGNGHPELNPDNETVVTICIVAQSNM
jgi:hypothetical protein